MACNAQATLGIYYHKGSGQALVLLVDTKEIKMQFRRSGGFILAAALALTLPSASLFAQDGAKQDMKDAGHETKAAAKDTGHGIKRGTKKGYHKTKHGLKKVGHKIEGKRDTPLNNPPQ